MATESGRQPTFEVSIEGTFVDFFGGRLGAGYRQLISRDATRDITTQRGAASASRGTPLNVTGHKGRAFCAKVHQQPAASANWQGCQTTGWSSLSRAHRGEHSQLSGGHPPPPHTVVDCADLVNDAAFLDQYGARTPTLRNVLRTPPRPKQALVRKVFGLPNHIEEQSVEGAIVSRVASLTDEPLQVRIDPATPWAPMLVDTAPFPLGTAQRAVAECAAKMYGQPGLADIGGFFYHVVPKRISVRCPNNS